MVRERSSSEQTIAERTRELVEANAVKDIFIGIASHELRTPLTTIKGISQMLRRRLDGGNAIDPKFLEMLNSSVRRMEILVDEILTTSLVDGDLFALHLGSYDLVILCRELAEEYGHDLGPALNVEVLVPTLPVEIDRERIYQVLYRAEDRRTPQRVHHGHQRAGRGQHLHDLAPFAAN